jgi:hypothetical protein
VVTADMGGERAAWFADSEGDILCLHQPAQPATPSAAKWPRLERRVLGTPWGAFICVWR